MNFRINEKSCSGNRNKVSLKIDFKAIWRCSGYADSVRVKSRDESRRVNTFDFSNEKDWSMSLAVYHFSEF